MELVKDYRHTPEIRALYEKRKETIERCFADAKEKYDIRYYALSWLDSDL